MKKLCKLFAVFMCLFTVFLAAGCGTEQPNQETEVGLFAVIDRFDRQNDVYYQLAARIDDYIHSEDKAYDEAQFTAFCEGVNCFVQNEYKVFYAQVCSENDVLEETYDLMNVTARVNSLRKLKLSSVDETKLIKLKETLSQLADECDRNKEDSFVTYFVTQDFNSSMFTDARNRVKGLLLDIDFILG